MQHLLIYPMFAMVLLTFLTILRLVRARMKAVADGETKASYYKTHQGGEESEAAQKLARHFTNLFETPVLFYVACLAALATKLTGTVFLVLAWLFVLVRCAHAWIHTGANRMQPRMLAYLVGWIVLLAMWGVLVFRLATVH